MFRPMVGRFLQETAALTGNDLLAQAARPIDESGARLSQAAPLFEDVFEGGELSEKIARAAELLLECAALEGEAFAMLSTAVYVFRNRVIDKTRFLLLQV